MNKKILAIIPARSGSKGIRKKNVKLLLNRPLLVWTIEQAKLSNHISRIFVSTDDEEIAQIARQNGVEVPFLRPSEFAQDSSPTIDAIIHALDCFEQEGERFDIIVLLEPTSPLRKDDDIDRAIETFLENSSSSSSLVSVGEVHLENPYIMKKIDNGYITPIIHMDQSFHQRQQLPKCYFPYGVIYLSTVEAIRHFRTFYQENTLPYFIERWQNYEIDDICDFYCVETILAKKRDDTL